MDLNKLWTVFQEIGTPDHLTCLLRNLYAGPVEQQLESDMEQWIGSKSGKGLSQSCTLLSYLFNLYAEYITVRLG